MGIFFNSGKHSEKVYNSALMGAFFGIFNVFYVFIPYLTSLKENKGPFAFYVFAGILILASLISITFFFKNEYTYNLIKLRYLLFAGTYTLVFYLGLAFTLYKALNLSVFSSDTYFMLLYIILSIMTAWDILTSVKKGFSKVKRFYTRTYKKQIFFNIIVVVAGVLTGYLLLLPQILSI